MQAYPNFWHCATSWSFNHKYCPFIYTNFSKKVLQYPLHTYYTSAISEIKIAGMRRTAVFCVAVASSAAVRVSPGTGVRNVPAAAAVSVGRRRAAQQLLAAAAALAPLAASADRGKDIYQSDRALLQGGTDINENVALPEYDDEG